MLTDNLVAYYKMEGNSTDSAGSNNSTDTAITYSLANGKIGQGALFNGSSSTINIGTALRYERTQPFTIAGWINTSTSTGDKPIYSTQENSAPYRGVTLWSTAGGGNKLYLTIGNTTGVIEKYGTTLLATGTWKFVVATYDGSSNASGVNLYVNAVLETMTTQTDTLSTSIIGANNVFIGSRAGGLFYLGNIDEVGIWSRALTSTEITILYNAGAGLQYPFTVGNPSAFFQFFN